MTAPAIAYMIPDSPKALSRLERRLGEVKADLLNQLVHSEDWDDFRERVGKVRGIETALAICAEIEKEMRN